MNENDLALMRLSVRYVVLEQAMQMVLKAIARQSPNAREALKLTVATWRQRSGEIRFPQADPVNADLFAAEFQEALAEFLKPLEEAL